VRRPELLVICEGPIDALSLAACGVPSLALVGLAMPEWIPAAAAFRTVALALDADQAGDQAAALLAPRLQSFGATVRRWRPSGVKDWNEALQQLGEEALAAAVLDRIGASDAA
jgi:DNA primase